MIMIIKRREMRNCFNNILIALNICDSLHLIFAIMDAVRNSFGQKTVRNICQNLGNTEYSKSMYDIFEGHIISLTLLVMRSNAAIRPLMRIVWNEKFCKKHLWDSPVSKFQKTSAQMLEKRAITLVTLVFEVQN